MAAEDESRAQNGTLVYALIGKRTDVLAEYMEPNTNIQVSTVTRVLLQRISDEDQRKTYAYDEKYLFHCIVEDGICFFVLSKAECSVTLVYKFLDDLKREFNRQYSKEEQQNAHAFQFNMEFARVLKERMHFFNTDSTADRDDKILGVQRKVDDTQRVMVENIDKLFERGELIDSLVDKTDHLEQTAFKFEKSANELKKAMWCKRVKSWLLFTFVLLIVLFFVAAFICGGLTFDKCKK